jgi:hypothetical protein
MAARRPIVSTSVPDVVASWGDVVWIADGPEPFARAIEQALREPEAACRRRQARAELHLRRSSWDAIAASMHALIARGLEQVQSSLNVFGSQLKVDSGNPEGQRPITLPTST